MKLWQKNYSLNKEIEKFTVGNDFLLDKGLVKYDVYGSIAHANMLNKIKIINNKEFNKLKKTLSEVLILDQKNKFEIKLEDEDVHTAIENYLTKKLGSLGKKIHTARSRNDQVLVDIRLYSKEKIIETKKSLITLVQNLVKAGMKNKNIPLPGYTHMRKAMPSSFGLLFGAYAESLIDNFMILEAAYNLNNQNPLGSASGYGVNLDIDRELTANLLGFEKVQNNVLYVQNSRGKIESAIVFALSKIMQDLAKISNDLILFTMEEFNYFKLPDEFCTGSSLMPNKKNPDVLELIRAKASIVESNLFAISRINQNLMSGYNRDLQLVKEPLIKSFEITLSCINILDLIVGKLKINEANCIKSITKDMFTTDNALELVKAGIPFRDAYKKISGDMEKIKKITPAESIKSKKHIGAPGNIALDKIMARLKKIEVITAKQELELESKLKNLAG